MNTSKDPTPDIYAMMDDAKLNAGYLMATREPMGKMIVNIRTELNRKICAYIEADRAGRPGVALQPTTQNAPEAVPSSPDPTKSGEVVPPAPSPTNESEFPL